MSSIDISMLLPHESPSKVSTMQYLWLELLRINNLLGKPLLEEGDIEEFESASKTWVDRFLSVYLKLQVTPYIHAMHSHVGQFLWQHGGLLPFTQQGLEKYNDRMTKTFFRYVNLCTYSNITLLRTLYLILFRATNMRSQEALVQLMQKANRLEFFQDKGLIGKPRDVRCGNCSEEGHYHLTCTKECKFCGFTPYCGHLGECM